MKFLVQIDEQPDGSLPPELWQTVYAENRIEAARTAAIMSGKRPPAVYVADENAKPHRNGNPFLVHKYSLTYHEREQA